MNNINLNIESQKNINDYKRFSLITLFVLLVSLLFYTIFSYHKFKQNNHKILAIYLSNIFIKQRRGLLNPHTAHIHISALLYFLSLKLTIRYQKYSVALPYFLRLKVFRCQKNRSCKPV